jgi:hypothetical protein
MKCGIIGKFSKKSEKLRMKLENTKNFPTMKIGLISGII